MFIVYDKVTKLPYSKQAAGHFTVYRTLKAARGYIYRNYLTERCVAKSVTYIQYSNGQELF